MLSKIEKNFLKRNNVFVLYNFYGLALAQESLPRGQEMYDFYRPFIGYHYNTLRLLNHAAELKENIFLKNTTILRNTLILTFYLQITSPLEGGGCQKIYNFSSPTYFIWSRLAQ